MFGKCHMKENDDKDFTVNEINELINNKCKFNIHLINFKN